MRPIKEDRLAKAAYNWLKASPFVTVLTLFIVVSMDIGSAVCNRELFVCRGVDSAYINFGLGVIVSSLWHLLLLQYVNNKDSEFVRSHGRRALMQAGIRTAIPLFGILADFLTGAEGAIACWIIPILLIMWSVNAATSKKLVEGELALEDEPAAGQPTSSPLPETLPSTQVIQTETSMTETDPRKPEDVLTELYQNLQSSDDVVVLQAIDALQSLNYSSEAIRQTLEMLSLHSANKDIRNDALAALNLPANRTVQKRIHTNKLDRGTRYVLLQEIHEWEKGKLLEPANADVIRRRYDFDFDQAPQTAPKPVATQQASPTPKAVPAAAPAPEAPPQPEGPRPTLLQTLTSEASIKIYLYLGAFFVIAAAAILGAVVPELRLPILILGTLIFGGLAVAIKKRLPQPSFALFIVFSFLLTITANSLEETLRDAYRFNDIFTAGYWVIVFFIMAVVWSASTWLYDSRLFSITAFGSLALALFRIGDIFDAREEFYILMESFGALAGLAGVWLIKKWRDEKFALPLFLAAQALQGILLIASISVFGVTTFDPASQNLWHLAAFLTWGLAGVFFILSNRLQPFFAFPWLAAATLVPMPWFLSTAFDFESLGSTIILFVWGGLFTLVSEGLNRLELTRKYSLPVLLASMPTLALGLVTGFTFEIWLGLVVAFGIAVLYTALHLLRSRWWLWTLALINFTIAYFAFFNLDFINRLEIFPGYQVIGIGMLFLLGDILLKKDWKASLPWRLPPRIFGALFTLYASIILLVQQGESGNVAVCFAVLTLYFGVYALAYRNALLGYLPAAYLPLAIVFALDAFNVDAWLPALTTLAVVYFAAGVALRANEKWSATLRFSALGLGSLVSLAALILLKETGGWYALVCGGLFIAEMALRKNGWFELGAPVLFNIGIFLILRDLNIERATYHLLAYSLLWILADLLAHLIFPHPRPLKWIARGMGASLTLINYGFLFTETDSIATFGFGIYTLLFLTVSLLYRRPILFYAFSLTLPLFVAFLFRSFDVTQWIHPVIVVAVIYYAAGAFLRKRERAKGWDQALLYSGLGVGVAVSFAAPILGGLDASLPVAVAATLWAVEAFAKRNAWLALPANVLYVLAYFIILAELKVDEPQFYSIGAALFGLIQHYLLTRAGAKAGTFSMGMFSQFVLLGTTYIQLIGRGDLLYFFLLFLQSLVVLVYGIVIRSRSLTFFPIGFVALGVITVVYSSLKDIGTIFLVGCTGIVLLSLGIVAVLLRERIAKLNERLSDWQA